MTRGARRLLRGVMGLLVFAGLAFGCVMGFRAVAGGEMGETCTWDLGCKVGMRCLRLHGLERTCTGTCGADVECPTGWRCGEVLIVDRSDALASIRQRACVPGDSPLPIGR